MQVIPAQVILEDNGVRRGDPLQAKQYTKSRFFGDDWYRIATWDGEETQPRCWHLIVRREVESVKTIKYTLSNAPVETPLLRLGQMQGQLYWVERAFEDAKGECGLADYQALG